MEQSLTMPVVHQVATDQGEGASSGQSEHATLYCLQAQKRKVVP